MIGQFELARKLRPFPQGDRAGLGPRRRGPPGDSAAHLLHAHALDALEGPPLQREWPAACLAEPPGLRARGPSAIGRSGAATGRPSRMRRRVAAAMARIDPGRDPLISLGRYPEARSARRGGDRRPRPLALPRLALRREVSRPGPDRSRGGERPARRRTRRRPARRSRGRRGRGPAPSPTATPSPGGTINSAISRDGPHRARNLLRPRPGPSQPRRPGRSPRRSPSSPRSSSDSATSGPIARAWPSRSTGREGDRGFAAGQAAAGRGGECKRATRPAGGPAQAPGPPRLPE